MANIGTSIKTFVGLLNNPIIKKRLIFTIGVIILYRFLANVPPPGIDQQAFVDAFRDNPLTNIFTIATGGRLDAPSLVMIGLGAYINASIIIQLLSTVIPKLEQLKEEGQRGRRVISQYTRYLTIPLSIMQSFVIYLLLKSASADLVPQVINLDVVAFIAAISAGSLVLMWLGEQISEKGLGNGSSLIITVSILSSIPRLIGADFGGFFPAWEAFQAGTISLGQFLSSPIMFWIYGITIGFIVIICLAVLMNEAVRKIVIQYARRTTGNSTNYLPIRVNQAGVMPIIFASAIITFPIIISQMLIAVVDPASRLYEIMQQINTAFSQSSDPFYYNLVFFILIIAFSFFYNFIIQKPSETTDNLKKSGAFIPGLRPGVATTKYLSSVIMRLTTIGALFLGVLAIMPSVASSLKDSDLSQFGILSGIGGTSFLIIVSVFLTTYRQIISMKVTKSYDQYR